MAARPDRASASNLLAKMAGRKVVVLGDLMLDQFIWGTVERISPEAPVPVVRVTKESSHLGGAGNVVGNIMALGGLAWPVGVTGAGPQAEQLRATLLRMRVPDDGVLQGPGRLTTVKTRIVAHHQQVVRFDREQDDPLDDATVERLAGLVLDLSASADALVVSDYDKGCVTPDVLSRVLPAMRKRGVPVVVDPKPAHWASYTPITAITPNQAEASRMSGVRLRGDDDLLAAGRAILNRLDCRGVLLTRGDKGMLLIERDAAESVAIPAAAREVFDVTGAGDTVVAIMALALAAGASLGDASALANAAAGVVVGKVGTATASSEEILAAI
ncbi:MAG TPA: D-glycero-beta-D-manno-heptose-7-phosphate kinase [Candidatus Polarisedimenticolia bacterium]|nr:D-glycero-beta-D-manno-heptose-7-phosphate kinase [Candidatus Polarisedimenticolia bacterium]